MHFVDTGKNWRVSVSDFCTRVPELALQIGPQALQCNLEGVTMVSNLASLQSQNQIVYIIKLSLVQYLNMMLQSVTLEYKYVLFVRLTDST